MMRMITVSSKVSTNGILSQKKNRNAKKLGLQLFTDRLPLLQGTRQTWINTHPMIQKQNQTMMMTL